MGNPFDDYMAFERMMKPIRDYERMMKPVREYERMMKPVREYERMMQPIREYERMMRPLRDAERAMKPLLEAERSSRLLRNIPTVDAWRNAERYMQTSRIIEEAFARLRQVEDVRDKVAAQQALTSDWERMRQQQELLTSTFRSVHQFGGQTVRQFLALDRLARTAFAFDANARASLGAVLDANAMLRLERELERIDNEPDLSLIEAIARAIVTAFRKSRKPLDWLAVMGLVFSVLTLLMGEVDRRASDAEHTEERAEDAWSAERRHQAIVRLLLAKHVRRGTRLWARDSSHSRVLQRLEAGQAAIVLRRRGKWTLVRVFNSAEEPPVQGWMLNQYLR